MGEDTRPTMLIDRYMADELKHDDLPLAECMGRKCFPHCDPRILHSPEKCEHCAKQTSLQQERVDLDVSNTGEMNRRWVCPADRDRPGVHQLWPGNTPEGYSKVFNFPEEEEVE